MAWMVNTGPHRAGSCIIESKHFTQTKFSKKWGENKRNSLKCPFIFIYLSLPEPWISYLEYCYIDGFSPGSVFPGSATGPWQLLLIISWKSIFLKRTLLFFFFFFKYMRGIGLGRKSVVITTFSDCVYRARQEVQWEREVVWAAQEQGGRCGAEHPGSLFAGLSRSLLLSHWVTLNEGSTWCPLYQVRQLSPCLTSRG